MFIYEYFRGSGKAMYRAQATLTATINGRWRPTCRDHAELVARCGGQHGRARILLYCIPSHVLSHNPATDSAPLHVHYTFEFAAALRLPSLHASHHFASSYSCSPPVFTFDFPQAPSHRLSRRHRNHHHHRHRSRRRRRRSHSNHHCHCHRRHLYSHMQPMPYRSNPKA